MSFELHRYRTANRKIRKLQERLLLISEELVTLLLTNSTIESKGVELCQYHQKTHTNHHTERRDCYANASCHAAAMTA